MWMLVLALVVLDQVSKFLVVSTMDLYESIPLLGDWLRITYIRNPGGAFGLRWGHVAVYYLAAALVIAWIVWHLWREGSTGRLSMWALALILAGALGNLVDRVLQGEVVDFIDCEFFDLAVPAFNLGILHHPGLELDRWPTFNVADSAVTIGVVALLVSLIRDPVVFAHPVAPAPEEPVAGHDVEESDHLPPASRTSA
ncbi:MAG TPA: signal peptidase II [bacterium]|nr:signal peptidase II [bacterium]